MEKSNLEPDIISNTTRRRAIHCNRRSHSDIQISVHSRCDLITDSHMNYTYGRFHQLRHSSSSSSTCHHDDKFGDSYTDVAKQHQHSYDTGDARVMPALDRRITGIPVPDDNSRLSYPHNSISNELFHLNLSYSSRPTSSKRFHCSQKYNRLPEFPKHKPAPHMFQIFNHYTRSSFQKMPRGNSDNRNDIAAANVYVPAQQMSEEFDPEIVRDIVRTLRIVGDDLDAKMRNYNEPFHRALLDTLKENTGQVLLTTVKQFNLVGVAMDASLALLKLLRQ